MPGRPQRGLTLIEVLVVASILSMLVAISIPALRGIRNRSQTATCAVHLRQLGVAITGYAGMFRDYIPPGEFFDRDGTWPVPIRRESWETLLVNRGLAQAPQTQDPTRFTGEGSVFRCPSGNMEVRSGVGSATEKYSESGDYYVHSWYGCNGDPYFVEDYPMPRFPADGRRFGMLHQLSRARRPGELVLLFDGSWMPRQFDKHVWPVHGLNDRTNVLFLDGHVQTFSYAVLFENWHND